MKTPGAYQQALLTRNVSRRSFLAIGAGGAMTAATLRFIPSVAAEGAYAPGKEIEGAYTFQYGTYVAPVDNALYQYATGDDGNAYYTTYDGTSWSGWENPGKQPAKVSWDPAPVSYDGGSQAYYTGDDGYIYQLSWDSYGEATWENVSGEYTFSASPYATSSGDAVALYGTATDGYVYHKGYTGEAGWGEWQPLNDAAYPAKVDAKPYSVTWDDHENAFWVGDDGKTYWNRYSYADQAWTGAKEIPADYTFAAVPYAVGYAPESALYAYSSSADGAPVYNTFSGEGWSGWQPYDAAWTASSTPNAYVYNDAMHVVYTSNDKHAYYSQYGAEGWSEGWEDLGANYGYDTQQYEYAGGLYLTYTGEDGSVYYRTFDGGGTVEPTPTPKVKY